MAERLDRAESSYRAALRLREALARQHPDKDVYRSNLCDIQNNLGITLQRAAKYEAAEAAHRAALAILEVLVRDRPARSDYQYNLSNTHNNLGTLYQLTGRNDQAEASLRLAAEILQALTRESPDVPDYALDLGGCELNLGRNENDRYQSLAAVDWLDKAILKLDAIYRREPRAGITEDFLFNAYVARAVALGRLGRYAKALDDWDSALVFEPNKKPGWKELERAFTLAHVGRHKEAIAVAESADAEHLAAHDRQVFVPVGPRLLGLLGRRAVRCRAGRQRSTGPGRQVRRPRRRFHPAVLSGRLLRESKPPQGPADARPHAQSAPLAAGVSGVVPRPGLPG